MARSGAGARRFLRDVFAAGVGCAVGVSLLRGWGADAACSCPPCGAVEPPPRPSKATPCPESRAAAPCPDPPPCPTPAPAAPPQCPPAAQASAAPAFGFGAAVDIRLTQHFYLYDDPEMTLLHVGKKCERWGMQDPDISFLEAARKHPMRTKNVDEAAFFVISIPATSLYDCAPRAKKGDDSAYNDYMVKALRKLVSSKAWTKTQGRRHVWMLFDWKYMSWTDHRWKRIPDDEKRGPLADHKKLLRHVTFITYENWHTHPATCEAYSAAFNNYCKPRRDFDWLPFEYWGCSVVVPYAVAPSKGPALDFDSWMRRQKVLYYRNDMKRIYYWNATEVRRKPMELKNLPDVSIGPATETKEFQQGLYKSKFCLVTRGDTPSSHKMFDAIMQLCVPVIISDLFDRIAKPFPTLLAWDTFTLSIPEADFMKDPKHAVAFLWTLSRGEMRRLHGALKEARRVLDWRAPGSLAAEATLVSALDTCIPEQPWQVRIGPPD